MIRRQGSIRQPNLRHADTYNAEHHQLCAAINIHPGRTPIVADQDIHSITTDHLLSITWYCIDQLQLTKPFFSPNQVSRLSITTVCCLDAARDTHPPQTLKHPHAPKQRTIQLLNTETSTIHRPLVYLQSFARARQQKVAGAPWIRDGSARGLFVASRCRQSSSFQSRQSGEPESNRKRKHECKCICTRTCELVHCLATIILDWRRRPRLSACSRISPTTALSHSRRTTRPYSLRRHQQQQQW